MPASALRSAFSQTERVAAGVEGSAERLRRVWLALEARSLPLMESAAALTSARIDLLPHQVVLTHRVATGSPRRSLIADEVGLGKTIETALILRDLAGRGELRRALMVVPAGLVNHWHRELNEVFHLEYQGGAGGRDQAREGGADRRLAALAGPRRLQPRRLPPAVRRERGPRAHRSVPADGPRRAPHASGAAAGRHPRGPRRTRALAGAPYDGSGGGEAAAGCGSARARHRCRRRSVATRPLRRPRLPARSDCANLQACNTVTRSPSAGVVASTKRVRVATGGAPVRRSKTTSQPWPRPREDR